MSAPVQPPQSLRDYFAGQALAGLLADPEMTLQPAPAAARALDYADASVAAIAARTPDK
jgi:hypothetical protein